MFSLLRDDVISAWGRDEERLAVEEEPRARRASALIFAVVALLYPAWHWIFRAVMPDARDPLLERLGISAIMVAAIVTFRFRRLRRFMPLAEQVLLFLMTGHYLSVVWRNDLAVPYMIGTFVVLAAVNAVISRLAVAVAFSVVTMGTVSAMGLVSQAAGALNLEYVVGTATILIAIVVGAYKTSVIRSASRERLSQGRHLLKQIIEAIPDPVFVRAGDRELVLSNEAGRQFENATGYDLRAVADQEDLALSGGHSLEADAEVHTRHGQMAVSVKTAVSKLPGRDTMLVTVMRDVTERRNLEQSLRQKVRELEEARERVRQLQGMLPICMHCSRIRVPGPGPGQPEQQVGDQADGKPHGPETHWETLESYVSANSNTSFTHTLCNICLEQHYPS